MKKKFIASILLGTMVMQLAACGSADSTTEETATEETEVVEETAEEETEAAEETEEAAEETEVSAEDSDVAYIQDKGTLIVGITDFAPMDYKDDNGEWIGFDADVAKKVAEDLGVQVQFVEIDWDNKILELENKSIDVVWNGMTLTDEVKNAMECTNAYCNNAQVVVVASDVADQYQDEESLQGLAFAVEAGSAGEAAAQELGLDYTSLTSQSDTLMEVSAGTSNACIIDLLMAGAMIGDGTSYPDLTHTVELTTEEYGVGCRKGSDLAAYINDEFKAMYDDGSLVTIAETYGVQDAVVAQ
ncbi:MAG: transporter substrate-binding domain-containing protein [Butyrivibrio sp.]|nr:transporter substrate-binding domain-containing protein [Butyrivibrio sp.]